MGCRVQVLLLVILGAMFSAMAHILLGSRLDVVATYTGMYMLCYVIVFCILYKRWYYTISGRDLHGCA